MVRDTRQQKETISKIGQASLTTAPTTTKTTTIKKDQHRVAAEKNPAIYLGVLHKI